MEEIYITHLWEINEKQATAGKTFRINNKSRNANAMNIHNSSIKKLYSAVNLYRLVNFIEIFM